MTKFHVDLGETRLEEPQPERQFKKFKSLRKAVRWARREVQEGRLDSHPDILNADGNPITIYWDDIGWLTREELAANLGQAEAAHKAARDRADKMQQEAAKRDNDLIKAGYIPVRALAPHLVDAMVYRDGGGGAHSDLFPRDFGGLLPLDVQTTYKLEFRQTAAKVGAEQHPFITAMHAIAERIYP